ncbi:hypothetical protein I312_100468 [Cryptococcus bacillisporus CA1280]|uniref:2,4-dihydroxyhept-2-ene-1,7-dioic acid aldolase n=2 Tax=Cryptococcus gattii TaxID=552467 RepID=A0A0D0TTN5_CRYGA|nr:2,4-dihydroxyhept-2-ene-1,7-dioic acid aldolase [Cryptococcus bacillisporus CA1280]KIR68450.1 2,4-dihydroxyhept-2-ene-1,7-dioic acid aldolase [Cryptococcus bacillisporus CA1873]|eukprot:KIR68450.1 2,4-dihydroxyhept-2-ene-1,7-dioic acid aldolase [Cryptococcus gattii CA1873]
MEKRTYLRNALLAGKPGIGMWLTLPGSALAKTVATIPGFNWILIDAEHGQITDRDYFDLNNHITAEGVSPIIRIPADEPWLIKRALDSGAHGLMIPMCHNAEIAKKVVSSSKYAARGTRGCGSPFTQMIFGVPEAQYEATCNDNLLVIVQIESAEGVKNVESIAAVDGVDVLFVGPFDLAKSMDIEFGGKEHEAAIARTLKACKDNGKKAAIFCMTGAQSKKRLQQGFDMVSIATDTDSIIREFSRQLEDVKA